MLRTGTDAYSGVLDHHGIRAADDMVVMPLQCGTQWDGLGHVFYENSMWNGYDCREVTSNGAQKCGIEKTKNRMVGRGVFLDVPRALGMDILPDGYAITSAELDATAKKQNVQFRRGDFIVVRTGQMEAKLAAGSWDGYSGDDAGLLFRDPGVDQTHRLAALTSDTWAARCGPMRPSRHQPALALDHDSHHGHDHGRDLLREGARRGLRRGQDLRIPVRRSGDSHHRRGRLANEPARDQIGVKKMNRTNLGDIQGGIAPLFD
jgi:hypothetical protein